MTIGQLRHRVDIHEIITTKNSDAGSSRNLVPYALGQPAAVNPQPRGRLFYAAQEQFSEVDSEIVLRYSNDVAGVKPKWQVIFGARVFQIKSVICPEERRRWLHLFCCEVNG